MASPTPNVPYAPYKPKRHSRNLSSQSVTPSTSPPPRPHAFVTNGSVMSAPIVPQLHSADTEKFPASLFSGLSISPRPASMIEAALRPLRSPAPSDSDSTRAPSLPASPTRNSHDEPIVDEKVVIGHGIPEHLDPPTVVVNGSGDSTPEDQSEGSSSPPHEAADRSAKDLPSPPPIKVDEAPSMSPPSPSPKPLPNLESGPASPRKTSTFRRIGPNTRPPIPSSPLRPPGAQTRLPSTSSIASSVRQFDQAPRPTHPPPRPTHPPPRPTHPPPRPTQPRSRLASSSSIASSIAPSPSLVLSNPSVGSQSATSGIQPGTIPPHVRPQSGDFSPAPSPRKGLSPLPTPAFTLSPASTPGSISSAGPSGAPRSSVPYRPGFQPKGVYRPRTDEFVELRKSQRDLGRIDRTRLERRLEKLVALHFSPESSKLPAPPRRSSSFFDVDFSDLRSKGAGELWRGVMQAPGKGKADIRAAEQKITPWQEDSTVSQCPLCTQSFHPLTNRKHHCRLCGQIMCSLPLKRPQRPVPCSLLFVADPVTGKIEEVGEGVDYGVRRRSVGPSQGKQRGKPDGWADEEKFLKGVRICRECRPVLMRQQYKQEMHEVSVFERLYEAFISLEKEIEDDLPIFHELMLSLEHDDQPTKEASATRKRLLEAFGQYDALSKRIRNLRAPGGPTGSQARMQAAVHTRANMFLQRNMFPLQSIPKSGSKPPDAANPTMAGMIDPDSEVAHTLQPLLEQEALLEGYVEEARGARKFEDAKTLKHNLREVRAEIDRMLAGTDK